jgi:hypothetical protein
MAFLSGRRNMKKFILRILLLSAFVVAYPAASHAEYKYANAEGEYIVSLPDAPLGETIWAQEGNIPLIDNPPKYGAIGEYAILKRVDPDTGDIFDVKITFVKADRDFLLSLTEAKVKDELEKVFSEVSLQNTKFNFSGGTDTLKWGTFSGFSVSQNNDILYNIAHYMAGEESVMMIRVTYSVENPTFNGYYKDLAKSITYMGH